MPPPSTGSCSGAQSPKLSHVPCSVSEVVGESQVMSSTRGRCRRYGEPELGDAFAATSVLSSDGCSALREALRWLGPCSPSVETLPLGALGTTRLARLRSELESVLVKHWDPPDPERCRLGDLAPSAPGSMEETLASDACSERSLALLRRAGCDRWPMLLSRTLAELSALPGVGRKTAAEVVAMCAAASLGAVAEAWVLDPGASDMAVILRNERRCDSHPLLGALLEQRSATGPPVLREAADRLLRESAPWALEAGTGLAALVESAGDERDRRLFVTRTLEADPAGFRELAEAEGISLRRVRELVERAEARVRADAQSAPVPLPWLVAYLRRRLGRLTNEEAARSALEGLGVDEPRTCRLALWLAGPYHAVPDRPGWLALAPKEVLAHTSGCLGADGGVRRVSDVSTELAEVGIGADWLPQWLQANRAVVVHDVVVSALGQLGDVVERILDAYGTARTEADIAQDLTLAGRPVATELIGSVTRSRRFKRDGAGTLWLTAWGDKVSGDEVATGAGSPCPRGSAAPKAAHPAPARTTAARTTAAHPAPARTKAARTQLTGESKKRRRSPDGSPTRGSPTEGSPTEGSPNPVAHNARSTPAERAGSDAKEVANGERLWLWVRLDADVLHGAEAAVPVALVERLGLARFSRRTFSSRWGPVALAYDDPQPTRGSVRAVALAVGARVDDTLLLGFSPGGDVDVDVRRSGGQAEQDGSFDDAGFFSDTAIRGAL